MATPTITAVSPSTGNTGGRMLVSIQGTNFQLPPPPPPLVFGRPTPMPPPTVEVLFGAQRAREVYVLSANLLHAVVPVNDPGVVSVTVRNIDANGAVVGAETATLANAFTYRRPVLARKPTDELTLQRVVRKLIAELRRQILDNVVLTTHTDFADAPSGANVAALASTPGIVLSGPTLIQNRELSINQARKKPLASGSTANLRPPRTVDLQFTLIGVDTLEIPMLALMSECTSFFQRNTVLELPADARDPDGASVDFEINLEPDGDFATIGSPGNSNIHAFSGTFRIEGVDIETDEFATALETWPVLDERSGVTVRHYPETE